ncbi:MAG: hypothetical protein LAO30_25545, partial [Acidobacteriia bacterium]|nr:hypothetical protein [Terriglobia bacterium]
MTSGSAFRRASAVIPALMVRSHDPSWVLPPVIHNIFRTNLNVYTNGFISSIDDQVKVKVSRILAECTHIQSRPAEQSIFPWDHAWNRAFDKLLWP